MRRSEKTVAGLALTAATLAGLAAPAAAEIVSEPLSYSVDGMPFEGVVTRDDAVEPRGVVMIVHDWDGLTEYERERAAMLAGQGYTAVALDLYGTEADPQGMEDYRRLSGALLGDRAALRARLDAAMAAAADLPGAGAGRVMIGYCFGGSAALEAARAGAGLDGFGIFHGGLDLPDGQDYAQVSGPVMLWHGSADPVSGPEDLAAVLVGLREAGVAHDARIYGNVRHSFTVPGSRDYDAAADEDSWQGLLGFLDATL
ncbi:dienelactone hydrolase [Pararhodobacter marinus]|uniref:Dienelactone hydrolase n=1 Tax=Pararhodobacter marinus TaxID=2184063 RepID=A0A2U2CB33_9RHOB|nr:dienelactone hydrolase family protein [Pararhodobacter marinus]PWE29072.1 dienelactone hydrolase [Pararhodobacter marinus]